MQLSQKLLPYEITTNTQGISLEGIVERKKSVLSIEFHLSGQMNKINCPPPQGVQQRLDQLWKHTCFEAFFSWDDNIFYWELNVSPTGDWNLYYFDDYRSGQMSEKRIENIPFKLNEFNLNSYKNRIIIDLSKIIPETKVAQELQLSLTAVLENKDLSKTYWATDHLGEKPDFHIRKSFYIRI